MESTSDDPPKLVIHPEGRHSVPDDTLPPDGEHVVAFLDLLDFRDITTRMFGDEPDLFPKVINAFAGITRYTEVINRIAESSPNSFGPIATTVFSDSIVVSSPGPNSFDGLANHVLNIIADLFENKMLCRGGVAVDRLYHTGGTVFGPAMIRAYQLESEVAVYPRVVIEDSLIPRVRSSILPMASGRIPPFRQDSDGFWFLNPFSKYWQPAPAVSGSGLSGALQAILDGAPDASAFSRARSIVEEKIYAELHSERRPRVLAKLRWLANLLNITLQEQHLSPAIEPLALA